MSQDTVPCATVGRGAFLDARKVAFQYLLSRDKEKDVT